MESKKSKAENGLIRERERGGQKGNRNAAKLGEELRFEMFLSKPRRMFFEE